MKVLAMVLYYDDTEVHYVIIALSTSTPPKGDELKALIQTEVNEELKRKGDPNWKPYVWEDAEGDGGEEIETDAALVGVFELSDQITGCDKIFYPGVSFNVS